MPPSAWITCVSSDGQVIWETYYSEAHRQDKRHHSATPVLAANHNTVITQTAALCALCGRTLYFFEDGVAGGQFSNNSLFVVYQSGVLLCIDPIDWHVRWRQELLSPRRSVYIASVLNVGSRLIVGLCHNQGYSLFFLQTKRLKKDEFNIHQSCMGACVKLTADPYVLETHPQNPPATGA